MRLQTMVVLFCAGALLACASEEEIPATAGGTQEPAPEEAAVAPIPADEEAVVIGHLAQRARLITIYAGDHGALYTIAGADGEVLAEKIDEQQLEAMYPDLHRDLKTAIAADDASLAVDAREPITVPGDERGGSDGSD